MDPTKTDWTEMNEMSSPNSGKHPSYKRTGSKDSMEVQVIFNEIDALLFQTNLTSLASQLCSPLLI